MSEKKVTSVSDYRKKVYKEFEVTVPSGAVFKVQRLSAIDFLKDGMEDLPNPFLEFLQSDGSPEKFKKAIDDKKTREFFDEFIRVIITRGILSPKVLIKFEKDKKEECLFWSEIEEKDQAYLINSIVGSELK